MDKKRIETIALENGLNLELYDNTRLVAGDRFLVSFEAEIRFDLKPEHLSMDGAPDFDEVKNVLGEEIVYSHRGERNFIDETDVEAVFGELKKQFLDSNLKYVSNPDFPSKLVLRKYRQTQTFTPDYLKI